MIMSRAQFLLNLYRYVYALKKLGRRGWVRKSFLKCPETVAAHSYGVGLIAMLLSDMKGLNTEKVLRLALLHDLTESIVGDLVPGEVSENEKVRREREALEEILFHLPAGIRKRYLELWEEYIRGGSNEALLVRDVDKLDMALQALEYSREFGDGKFKEFVLSAIRDVRDKEISKFLEHILSLIGKD